MQNGRFPKRRHSQQDTSQGEGSFNREGTSCGSHVQGVVISGISLETDHSGDKLAVVLPPAVVGRGSGPQVDRPLERLECRVDIGELKQTVQTSARSAAPEVYSPEVPKRRRSKKYVLSTAYVCVRMRCFSYPQIFMKVHEKLKILYGVVERFS